MAALVDPSNEEEQRAGRYAVVDHLQHAARKTLIGQRIGTDHDEAKVGHRRIRNQPLEVFLHDGRERTVNDADRAEREHHRTEPVARLRKKEETEADQTVGTHLEHDAGQDHRTGGGCLSVGVGQPGVHREQRHLDGKRQSKGEEQPA